MSSDEEGIFDQTKASLKSELISVLNLTPSQSTNRSIINVVKELLKDDSTNQCVNVVSFYREVNSLSIKADVCKHMMAQHHSHKDMANGLLPIKMSLKLSPSCTMKELVKYFKTTQARS